MNSRILLSIFAIALLGSCSTAYKSSQTPDDVYYSPAKQSGYVRVETEKDRDRYQYEDDYYYSQNDWLRWKIRNRSRWSVFNDYDSWNYYNTWPNSWSNPWNYNNFYWNNYYWNNYYNPYCGNVIVVNPNTNPKVYTKIRNYTPGTYNNTTYNNTNNINSSKSRTQPGSYYSGGSYNTRSYNNYNKSSNSGNKGYNPSYRSNERPVRTYSPSPSSSPSGSPSSGGGRSGSISSPTRPGRG